MYFVGEKNSIFIQIGYLDWLMCFFLFKIMHNFTCREHLNQNNVLKKRSKCKLGCSKIHEDAVPPK